jgi:hypothetical protein
MPVRTLKLAPDTPVHVSTRLVNKYGYYVKKKCENEYTLFGKQYNVVAKDLTNVVIFDPTKGLSEDEKLDLQARCDRIVEHWKNPYDHLIMVRTRLHNMSQALTIAEQAYVREYIDEWFPLEPLGAD